MWDYHCRRGVRFQTARTPLREGIAEGPVNDACHTLPSICAQPGYLTVINWFYYAFHPDNSRRQAVDGAMRQSCHGVIVGILFARMASLSARGGTRQKHKRIVSLYVRANNELSMRSTINNITSPYIPARVPLTTYDDYVYLCAYMW